MDPHALVVIPARYPSTRFPGKPLALLKGRPMIEHVVQRALLAKKPDKVIVATDDQRIIDALPGFHVVLTSNKHLTGSDRVAEVAAIYPASIVVNLQGDLPLFAPSVLDRLIERGGEWILEGRTDVVTLAARMGHPDEFYSKHTVKLVCNKYGDVLYFSRSPIPFCEKMEESFPCFKHFGVYLYSRDFLLKMTPLQGTLEKIEGLEQLRFLEEGGRIRVLEISPEEALQFCEVNIPDDLIRANLMLEERCENISL